MLLQARSEEEREKEGPYEEMDWKKKEDLEDEEYQASCQKWRLKDPMMVPLQDIFKLLQGIETLLPLLYRGMTVCIY